MRAVAQQPRQVKVSEIIVSDIATIEGRVFVMHRILDKGYYCFKNANASNTIDVYVPVDAEDELSDFDFFYDNVINELLDEFYYLDKSTRGELFKQWSPELGNEVFEVILEDFTKGLREGGLRADNVTCEDALPFCSNEEQFIFYPNVHAGNLCGGYCGPPYNDCPNANFYHSYADGSYGDYYDGIARAPDPAFYFMQVGQSGNLDIHIVGTTSTGGALDVDFVCWGPFSSIHDICNLSCDNMVDASYHESSDEHCYINNAQTGQYYTLLLTNYSDVTGYYTFTTTGSGTTNCDIMPPVVDNNGPYCIGETIELTAMALEGSPTYSWSGPPGSGWTSNQQNPTRPNCTLAMAGTYTCTITYNGQTSSNTTNVVILSAPVAAFTMSQSTVCKGTSVSFTNTSYNPSPGTITSWDWSFGDGSVSILQNPTHVYSTAGTYTVTLTVDNGACTNTVTHTVTVVDSQTYDEYATSCGPYVWNDSTYTTSGTFCKVFPGSGSEEPEPCDPNTHFNNDFENGLGWWTTLDADNDGHSWQVLTHAIEGFNAHTGYGWATSESYINYVGALNPDNFLISPLTEMTVNQHTVSFWACAQDVSAPEEYFGIAVSTTTPTASAFSMIQEWTMTRVIGTWHHYTVDLSAYIGQQIYVAIRHYNCTDQFRLNVDDIRLVCTDGSSIPCNEDTPFNNNFEDNSGLGNGWTARDVDNDEETWYTFVGGTPNRAFSGIGYVTSPSADFYEDIFGDIYLDPKEHDNYLISPRTLITANQHTLSFWARADEYLNRTTYEHFGVYVSASNSANPNTNTFTLVTGQQWTLSGNGSQSIWNHYTVDLSTYIGQQIYVAIRHYYAGNNPDGGGFLDIDQVELLCSGNRFEQSEPTRGCDSIVCLHLTVYPEPVASFTATTVCQGTATQFTNTSTGQNINSYQWNFGDGHTSSAPNPTNTFSQPGTHQVTLIVSNGNCSDTITNTIVVLPSPDVTITVDPSTQICAGDTVTLTAEVDTAVINYVAPGDILCTDNTIVRPSDWPVSGKTAKGVVFYVDNSGSHGWAVSLTQSGSLRWSTGSNLVGAARNSWRYAIRDLNGMANTTAIRSASSSTTHPAAWWYPSNLGTGWYLPSIGQLNVLFGELVAVNASLGRISGATQITDSASGTSSSGTYGNLYLWSSTEKSTTHAYALEILDGQIGAISKTATTSGKNSVVRAIIDF